MPSINEQLLDDIFGIPKDGSNIREEDDESQETSYAEVIKARGTEGFEQKSKKLNEVLAKDAPMIEVTYVAKEQSNEAKIKQEQIVQQPAAELGKNSFEEILKQSVLSGKPVSEETKPVAQKQTAHNEDTNTGEEVEETKEESVTTPSVASKADEDGWTLVPPSPMFAHFYSEKQTFIKSLTRGGKPLLVDKLMNELRTCHVSTSTELMDLEGMADKLNKIQSLLDRVVEIKIQATGQCSASKRGVELLRGVLAKVTYEKPAARQDGVIHDHMKDIEMYACEVEALEQAAKDVYHNLLESKEILSRKISITLELLKQQNITDSHEKNYANLSDKAKKVVENVSARSAVSPEIAAEGFDRLEVQEAVKAQSSSTKMPMSGPGKTGKISWLDD
jgi:hypothetical protein